MRISVCTSMRKRKKEKWRVKSVDECVYFGCINAYLVQIALTNAAFCWRKLSNKISGIRKMDKVLRKCMTDSVRCRANAWILFLLSHKRLTMQIFSHAVNIEIVGTQTLPSTPRSVYEASMSSVYDVTHTYTYIHLIKFLYSLCHFQLLNTLRILNKI